MEKSAPEGFEPPTLRSEVFRGVIRNPPINRALVATPPLWRRKERPS
jgi:hypothetical protein